MCTNETFFVPPRHSHRKSRDSELFHCRFRNGSIAVRNRHYENACVRTTVRHSETDGIPNGAIIHFGIRIHVYIFIFRGRRWRKNWSLMRYDGVRDLAGT